jgi:glycosyltransferase involved in cell wall biosynthesis
MISNKNTLIISDWFYPGYKAGGPISSLYNLMELIGAELRPKIFTRNTDWFDSRPYDLESDSWTQNGNLEIYYSSKNHFLKIIKSIRRAEVIYLNGFYSGKFNSGPLVYLLLLNRNSKIIVAPRGMLGSHALSLKSTKKKILIAVLKYLGIESRVVFHAASEEERQGVISVYSSAKVEVVANVPLPPENKVKVGCSPSSFISVGRISQVKNTLGLMKLIKSRPGLDLVHVGTGDDQAYESKCKNEAPVSVRFVDGANRREIDQMLDGASYFISMTTGENFGHAVIEALSRGCPVILSDRTPWNDIESLGAGWIIPLEDEVRWKTVLDEAQRIKPEVYEEMSTAALRYVKHKFDFDDLRMKYLKLFQTEN